MTLPRAVYDPNQPQGSMSLSTMRSTLRGLHQMDFLPLRCRSSFVLDEVEYSTDAAAQAVWSGTGVTITSSGTAQVGSYGMQAVIDVTGNREMAYAVAIDLSAYLSVTVWERCASTSSAITFYLEDSGGNRSIWNITTNGTADTWQQDTLTLASPDSNNGSDADLSDIVEMGFAGLDASETYIFDEIRAIMGLGVAVEDSRAGDFYKNVYIYGQPLEKASQSSPTLNAPSANPRNDILYIDASGDVAWVTGDEAASPTPDWASVPRHSVPLCVVYSKTTMTKVVDYEEKDVDTNQGYILADVRPFMNLGDRTEAEGSNIASAATIALPNQKDKVFYVTGTTNITTIVPTYSGHEITLIFASALTVNNASGNVNLPAGSFITETNATLKLVCRGSAWYEVSRASSATSGGGTAGSMRNLRVTYVTAATVDIDADEVVVQDTNGNSKSISTVNLTVNIGSSGANGLDTGSEGSSRWYFIWVIRKSSDGTVAGLLSESSTSPTLPTGYDQKALISAVYNDASSNFVDFVQHGREYSYPVGLTIATGNVGSTWVAISMSAYVPSALSTLAWGHFFSAGSATVEVSNINTGSANIANTNTNSFGTNIGNTGIFAWRLQILTANTLYWGSGAASARVRIHGFTINRLA